jgi:ribonuclease HI
MTYYAVHTGHNPGIYMTWEAAKKEVDGYQGAVYRGFKNIKDAEYFTVHGTLALNLNVASAPSLPPSAAANHVPLPVKMVSFSAGVGSKFQQLPQMKLPSPPTTQMKLPSSPTTQMKLPSPPTTQMKPQMKPPQHQLSTLLTKYKKHIDYLPAKPVVHIYTDGSTIGNGRKNATGGYGVFIPGTTSVKERLITRELINGKITNGVAELKAMMRALEEILLIDIEVDEDIELEFIIHYDSTYAADVVTGKKAAKANLELVQSCRALLAECVERVSVEFQHVYSHTGKQDIHSIGNEIADKLAGGV